MVRQPVSNFECERESTWKAREVQEMPLAIISVNGYSFFTFSWIFRTDIAHCVVEWRRPPMVRESHVDMIRVFWVCSRQPRRQRQLPVLG
jgi:uncharacterized membrane protein